MAGRRTLRTDVAVILAVSLVAAAACETARSAPLAQAAQVDSTISRDEALQRFRANLRKVTSLEGGASSRDGLVRAYLSALEKKDTAGLNGLLLSRAEFGWLYYETNPQALPPYDLSPGLMWFMNEEGSGRGLSHALEQFGGRALRYAGHVCLGEVSAQGANRVWGPCVVRLVQAGGDTTEQRLFGLIVERAGRFKLVSHANRL